MRKLLIAYMACFLLFQAQTYGARAKRMSRPEMAKMIVAETKPLQFPRGKRLPLYLWPTMDIGTKDDAETETMIRQLNDRGIGVITSWNPHPRRRERSLAEAVRIAAIQKKLGIRINVNANRCVYLFCNGDERTAHVTADGEKFFDMSFSKGRKMGCPFALKFRWPDIKEQLEYFCRAYKEKGLSVDFAFADWEIDGPIEWNGAWEASKKCKRCRENIPCLSKTGILPVRSDDFAEFQKALRIIRSDMQREVYAKTMKSYFPKVLVGNYSVYPQGRYRHWYDYYEKFVEGAPHKKDQRAIYRQWFDEFPLTGYTFAMPVVYTWYPTFNWYDFTNPDYRWFYNLLLVATNACQHTPREVPVISFMHWHTTAPPKDADPNVKQFSEEKYQELLWHMFLRGTDALILWCPRQESVKETVLLHQVYAAALEYRDFLDKGEPISFDVPSKQSPVVSGLRLGNKVLVRRTDFDDTRTPVTVKVGEQTLTVPRVEGKCQVLTLGK